MGGGLYVENSNPILINCTFAGNSATYFGGGIYCNGGSPVLTNCILWGDTPDEISMFIGTLSITYSNIQGGFPGEGNIDAEPLFADAANGDYHLLTSSPCIDAGDPNSEFTLEPEPNGGRINMGAYGGTPEASKSP
jgi:predicted outer membrane repeat protein